MREIVEFCQFHFLSWLIQGDLKKKKKKKKNEHLYVNIFDINFNQFPHVWNIPQEIKENINISIEVFLLEIQNWYFGNHLGKIPIMWKL